MASPFLILFLSFAAVRSECVSEEQFLKDSAPHLKTNLIEVLSQKNRFAQGMFGELFEGKWDDKPAAFKKTLIEKGLEKEINKLLVREERILRTLRGVPGVIDFYGCMKNESIFLFVFPRMKRDLEKGRIQFQKMTLSRRINFYKQTAYTLADLHSRRILHNDFKPANIMAPDSFFWTPKIIDFGLSCEMDDEDKFACEGGSPFFNSPEKVNSETEDGFFIPDEKIDVWAFLLTIVDIEKKGAWFYSNFYDHINEDCFYVDFSPECFKALQQNITAIFNESNSPLQEFVLSNLQYFPQNRKPMKELARELEFLEKADPSYDPGAVPPTDFTLDKSYQERFWQEKKKKKAKKDMNTLLKTSEKIVL